MPLPGHGPPIGQGRQQLRGLDRKGVAQGLPGGCHDGPIVPRSREDEDDVDAPTAGRRCNGVGFRSALAHDLFDAAEP
jgi:hypothetical protein